MQIILWLNGGPGCSSMYGLLTQWGSQTFKADGSFADNIARLNDNATVIYLDQPIGVGFSYSRNAQDRVHFSSEAADDVFEFLRAFRATAFGTRTFNTQALHVAGESYAGHYIPFIAERILAAAPPVRDLLRLKSIIIGNGFIDQAVQLQAIYDLICDANPNAPNQNWMLTAEQCATWNKKLTGCLVVINRCRSSQEYCGRYVTANCQEVTAANYRAVSAASVSSDRRTD